MSTQTTFIPDLEFRPLIDIDAHRLITDPKGSLKDLDKRIQELKAQGKETFEVFSQSPVEGVKRIWTQSTGHQSTFASKIGIVSNLLIAAGLFVGNPVIITLSLIASSMAHVTGAEEALQKEMIERTIAHLTAVNQTLVKTNESLKKEVEDLKKVIQSLREENEKLITSNQELKRSISDLQKNITLLHQHIASLEKFNTVFKQSLKTLQISIEHFKKENGKTNVKVESIQGLEQSFQNIRRELTTFSDQFQDTRQMLSTQHQDISQQLANLTDLVQMIVQRMPDLSRIQELSIVQAQFNIAIEGVRQYQELLTNTQANLESAQNRCSLEHNRMQRSRKSCEKMLHKFERLFSDRTEYNRRKLAKRFEILNRTGR